MDKSRPIGVFDSGIGGLTVYRALREALPHENFVYLGDTARLPYGTKSQEAVETYTLGAAQFLTDFDIKFLVIACNTASAHAMDALKSEYPLLPQCGVITTGAAAAHAVTKNKKVAVIATEGTIRSQAYTRALHALAPDIDVQSLATQLLVALAEEGWREGKEAEAIVSRYLDQLPPDYDTLLLGCTHFPVLIPVLHKLAPPAVTIVDSAIVTAQAVSSILREKNLLNAQSEKGRDAFYVTDLPERFARLGKIFLEREISDHITLANLPILPPKESRLLVAC